ncbi:MAG: pentapeptide repeat-containing protein [Chlorobaculum sp.]|jgi:hypothetical protein|nr:pentapeptide repeat-containing protein [Chlorobaculum sp.]
MANEEQLKILRQGVEAWNQWRKENPVTKIDLSGADLRGIDLSGIDLSDAYLSFADLTGTVSRDANFRGAYLATAKLERADFKRTNLTGTNLWLAKLKKANLTDANLTDAELLLSNLNGADLNGAILSGAVIDSNTKLRGVKGITRGVNGIYSIETKTAALMNMTPDGDSMQGSSVEAVLDNLKHARRLHSISLLFAGVTLLSFVLHLEEITVPFNILKKPIDAVTFAGLSVIISATLMLFVTIFFSSALDGTKYLTSRESAMKVGQFPWVLSKYEKGVAPKIISTLLRIILCFHPFIFLVVLSLNGTLKDFEQTPILFYLLLVSVPMLLATCIWLFRLSIGFFQPIVFDVVEEAKRQSGEEKIASAIREQTEKIDELVKLLQERDGGH